MKNETPEELLRAVAEMIGDDHTKQLLADQLEAQRKEIIRKKFSEAEQKLKSYFTKGVYNATPKLFVR